MQRNLDSWIPLGTVGKPHGVRGDLRLRMSVEGAGYLREGQELRLTKAKDGGGIFRILHVKALGTDSPIVTLEGIGSREAAALLTGAQVELEEKHFPRLAEGEFYVREVIGHKLVDENGAVLGEVTGFWEGGGRSYLVCSTPRGEAYLPLIKSAFKEIDSKKGEVRADPATLIYPGQGEP